MKSLLMAALSATAICGFAAATPALAQATVTGAPKGTAPVTDGGVWPFLGDRLQRGWLLLAFVGAV